MSADNVKSLLKETQNLPDRIVVSKLITNRAKEIQELEKLYAQSTSTKLVFQRLPKHMRRRAMSHYVNRLPRIARQAHLNQMKKSGLPPKIKRPSRKFRRRPKNLLQEYIRRQRQHRWLETHIWHAKRFRMVDRWGFRLPFKPNDKAFRACYRASAYHCLVQDVSYISCIEITGIKSTIISQLHLLTNPNTGLTVGAQAFKNGNREGDIVLYQKNCYPLGAIGQVKFMWKAEENETEIGCLWLWIHPAFYSELLNCLIDIFKLQENQVVEETVIKSYSNELSGIKLAELKHLNRFRLTGPLAHSIIKKLEIPLEENITPWFTEYIKNPRNKIIYEEQKSFWEDLNMVNSTSELPAHLILNLIVLDPRYSWPSKRTKAIKQNNTDDDQPHIPEDIKFGTIWCPKVRSEISKNVLNTNELIEKRKNNIVPALSVPLDASAIPIMLVQQPGNSDVNIGYGSGWDIIIPSNWGRPFWFNFKMWGGRSGGVKESQLLLFEQGLPDILYPDTKAGKTEENRITEMYKTKFFSLPPNKRTNYIKYGIACPFNFAWKILVMEWSNQNNIDDFFVMRDKKQLRTFQEAFFKNIQVKIDHCNKNCIIPVKLSLLKRGKVSKFAIICLPQENDYKNEPNEPIHKDQNQQSRKDIRNAHQKLLKKLRRRRIRAREKGEEPSSTKQIINEHREKMRDLWLPEAKNVRYSCSREVFGFVTNGDFSLTAGKGQCVGYIALGALPVILNNEKRNIVLVRDSKNKQYKLAKMEIICK